jgi:AcrR family transcriptional regulator
MIDSKENKKEQILLGARRVFAKYGFSKTTLDDIGEQVGMKKNSLYHYFVNKEEIFNEIIRIDIEEYFKRVETELNTLISPSEKLRKFVLISSEFGQEKSSFYKLSTAAKTELADRFSGFYKSLIKRQKKLINKVLIEGMQNNDFIKHDSVQLSEDLIDLFVAIEHLEFKINKQSFLGNEYFFENSRKKMNLLNFIIKGLEKK